MKKIVLLGTAPSSMRLAPFGNEEWEIWACSPGTYRVPRIDQFFELHRWEPGQEWFSEDYVKFLQEFPGTVYMSERVESVPGCTLLPWESLVDEFGPFFFTSSLAWMCAMAIRAGATTIAFYGVDMAAASEYENQRLGCQYIASIARSRGIEIGVPPESDLFRPAPLYGVCEVSHSWIKQTARARELAGRLRDANTQIEKLSQERSFLQGALDDQDWQLHSWFGNVDAQNRYFCSVPVIPALVPQEGDDE